MTAPCSLIRIVTATPHFIASRVRREGEWEGERVGVRLEALWNWSVLDRINFDDESRPKQKKRSGGSPLCLGKSKKRQNKQWSVMLWHRTFCGIRSTTEVIAVRLQFEFADRWGGIQSTSIVVIAVIVVCYLSVFFPDTTCCRVFSFFEFRIVSILWSIPYPFWSIFITHKSYLTVLYLPHIANC